MICGITTLLIAANRREQNHVCRDILIGIKGNEGKFYVEKEDVLKLLEKVTGGSLLQRDIRAINLGRLEDGLKTNPWIKNAELYFDSKDALHVFVQEREPIARVFTIAGNSFYMDSSGARMPLLDNMSIRVPVVTGFTSARKFNGADSTLLQQTKQVVRFIYSNEFWNAQVGQIDITTERKFELIPVIGDHIIKLGDGENVEEKLNNLYVFYKQVMSKVGFNKYAALDVQYDGQVIAIKKEPASPVDSIQLQKNIQELMNKANMQNIEEDMLPAQDLNTKTDSTVSTTAAKNNLVSTKTISNPIELKQSQNTARTKVETNPIPKKQPVPIEKPRQNVNLKQAKVSQETAVKVNKAIPKAVMPKQNQH
ncbi:MAG: cell division protein FtsQ/DivIB [Flavisolibacter sp.]